MNCFNALECKLEIGVLWKNHSDETNLPISFENHQHDFFKVFAKKSRILFLE